MSKDPTNQSKEEHSIKHTTVKAGYTGPFPQASEIERYERVLPGSADRILTMVENEQDHRFSISKLESYSYWSLRFISYIGVFILVGVMIYGSYLLFEADSKIGAAASAFAAVATILTSIIAGASKRNKE